MGSLKKFETTEEVVEILKCSTIEGNILFLPDITLERCQYEAVNKVLTAMGAKWNKKTKGHVFDYDIQEELKNVIKTKSVTDWKKSTDFFYTPDTVVNEMLGLVNQPCQAKIKILEPSAGQGHILDLAKENFPNAEFIIVEQNPRHCERLRQKGYSPIQANFMDAEPIDVDLVLMNPPFTYETEHIRRAYDFLNVGGQLITIASGGVLEKNTKKYKEFRRWFDERDGYNYQLPENSFKEAGTSVNTQMLIIGKEA